MACEYGDADLCANDHLVSWVGSVGEQTEHDSKRKLRGEEGDYYTGGNDC